MSQSDTSKRRQGRISDSDHFLTGSDGKADIIWQYDNGTLAVWLFDRIDPIGYGPPLTNPGSAWHIV